MLILYQQFSFHVCCVFHLEIPIQMLRYYLNQQRTCSSYTSPFTTTFVVYCICKYPSECSGQYIYDASSHIRSAGAECVCLEDAFASGALGACATAGVEVSYVLIVTPGPEWGLGQGTCLSISDRGHVSSY